MIWLLIDSSSVGGAERHVATLAQSLRRLDIDATVVLYGDHGANPWLVQLAAADVPARVLDNSARGLLAALGQDRPALLHTHGYKAGILGRLAARLIGLPVVSTFHAGERGLFPVGLYDWLDEWTSVLGQRIAVSQAIQQRLPFQAVHIPSFVLAPAASAPAPLPRRVGFVGRLSEEKAPDLFCEIARQAPGGIEWHIYGDGPMRAGLEHEHGAAVRFHGVVTDMAPVWSSLGRLLMPSRFEGVPLAALEALAQGVPVLASRVGGMPSVVIDGATGWLFEQGNVGHALQRLADWSALDAAGQAALRHACTDHVREHFSEARYLPDVLAVYRAAGVAIPVEAVAPGP